jgi:hypothetical protein
MAFDALHDALVRPSRVVVRLVFDQDGAQMRSVRGPAALGAGCRRGARRSRSCAGAWTAVRRILVPAAWKTASKDA